MTAINMSQSSTINLHTDPKAAALLAQPGERTITARFRNPARVCAVNISNQPWEELATIPENYRPLLAAVLETAAKSILSRLVENFSVFPATVPSVQFTGENILAEASGANSDWMSKEDLEQAWRASATRKQWIETPAYKENQAMRRAVAYYEGLILKLAGKTSQYQETDLDLMLAKLKPEDLETDLGSFMIRRIEALKNKPAKTEIDADLL